jgi:hypothetical protein
MISFAVAVISLVLVTAALVFIYFRLGVFWPSQAPAKIVPAPIFWRYGDVAWRGCLRMLPVAAIGGGTCAVASFWCFMLLTSFGSFQFVSNQAARDWLGWGLTIGFVGMIAAVPLSLSVLLFNWPKIVVPPGYRYQPGAVDEWRHQTPET